MASRVQQLKDHLLRGLNDIHLTSCPTLKDVHIQCVLQGISAQQYGPLIEKYIIEKHGYTKNRAAVCKGDCAKNEDTVEIKVSLGGAAHTKFNYVQIRPSQAVTHYLLTAYHLVMENVDTEGELYLFRVPKSDMKTLLIAHGGYAHGTKKEHGAITAETVELVGREFALRPTLGDACWRSLMPFRITEDML
jgi:hypothetical protein